jgi:hypothetical protein
MSATSGRSPVGTAAAIAIALAGLIHLVIVPQHYAHAPAHGIFFFVVGLIEIGWSILYFRSPSRRLIQIGLGLGSMLLVLWILTRSFAAPFGHGIEPVDTWAVVCKLSELLGVIALAILAYQTLGEGTARQANTRAFILAFVLGLGVALATYVAARAAEPLLPGLAAPDHDDHHTDGDASHEEHQHEEYDTEATHAP